MIKPLLEIKNVTYRYGTQGRGIQNMSLALAPGSQTALLGANGSGKTTLFLTLNGTLPPRDGEIFLDGVLAKRDAKFLRGWRSRVGLVLQDPNSQLVGGSVSEDVALAPRNLGLSKTEVATRVTEALDALGIADLSHRSISELSYGQKKRVAIAGILTMKPSLLLLDEPTAGLDARGIRELMTTLSDLHQRGMAMVMSTHDSNLAYSWADSVVLLDQGRLLAQGKPAEVFPKMASLGLEDIAIPTLLELWHSLPAAVRAKHPLPDWGTLTQKILPLTNLQEQT